MERHQLQAREWAEGTKGKILKGKTGVTMFPQRPQTGQSSESSRGHREMILVLALKLNSSQEIKKFPHTHPGNWGIKQLLTT